ncbi:methyltransferase domain-containing protein [Lentzea sp. NBRC 102530]|uniref:SAM-dependent methyltransferase n=1 Tax=Lentzea sp. NBRC 102530 TaxID=3032201 RepID=UPI002555E1ED|nr:methyltransferase domain-containing protein [Lentzea sp. NBRC 102530]
MAHLLHRAVRGQNDHLIDLGCGDGTWLLRALQTYGGATAVGVDISGAGFDDVLGEAARLGVADRLELRRQDVAEYRSSRKADLVLSVGAAYAFGGLLETLNAAREHLAEDGLLLLGDCFWEHEPDPAVRAEIESGPQKFADLPTTVAQVVADGWTPVYGHTSTIEEWDEYQWCWTGTLAQWALDHPDHPDSEVALRMSADHRTGWLGGYRGVLGFVVLLLRRTPPSAPTEAS